MHLVTVPVKAKLTEIEEFLLDHILDYGIIAGGFAAYLYNPEKKYTDIDLFVNDHIGGEAYDKLYHHLDASMNMWKKMKWRMVTEHPRRSSYNEDVGLQVLYIYDDTLRGKGGYHAPVQVVSTMQKDSNQHATVEGVLSTFDWNVCRAAVLDKRTLLVDEVFIDDMDKNICTFRPYPPRKTMNNCYGWRVFKYVELKGYDMPFKDMLTIFGLCPNKKQFYEQVFQSKRIVSNKNLIALGNYVRIMMHGRHPDWDNLKEF